MCERCIAINFPPKRSNEHDLTVTHLWGRQVLCGSSWITLPMCLCKILLPGLDCLMGFKKLACNTSFCIYFPVLMEVLRHFKKKIRSLFATLPLIWIMPRFHRKAWPCRLLFKWQSLFARLVTWLFTPLVPFYIVSSLRQGLLFSNICVQHQTQWALDPSLGPLDIIAVQIVSNSTPVTTCMNKDMYIWTLNASKLKLAYWPLTGWNDLVGVDPALSRGLD